MQKFMEKLDQVLTPVADLLSNNKFLRSMANGLIGTMPLTMIASIFYLINNLPAMFQTAWPENVSSALLLPYNVLFGLLALVISFTVAYEHAKNYKELKTMQCGIVSLVTFVVIAAPYTNGSFDGSYLGYGGIFSAVLVALLSVEIFNFLVVHKIRIKMPDVVPPLVSNSFEAMIPLFIIMGGFYGLNLIVQNASGLTMPAWIASVVSPAIEGADSWQYQSLYHLLMQLFFWLGMHGWAVTAGFSMPIAMAMQAEQASAYAAGEALPYITTGMWSNANLVMVVPIALLIFCKAERNRAIGKMALIPSIFGISEPYTFGTPIVLNPILGIPFVLYQPLLCIVDYYLIYFGIWPRTAVSSLAGVPMPFNRFLVTGNWMCFVIFAVELAVCLAIWYPFIKVWDNKCLREQAEIEAAKANAEVEGN
ncbi:MAG: PTS sugar transporter subunit IIC [Traorella sp.]